MAMLARNEKPRILMRYRISTILVLMMSTNIVLAVETTTTVTPYVIRTQEEREKTRWTLTEWLRIKERMKLMDVWLAMFSDPTRDKFTPELNASIMNTKSTMQRKVDGTLTDTGSAQGNTVKAQAWLTNLVSSNIGIRVMNIDLGFEAGGRDSGILTPDTTSTSPAAASILTAAVPAELPSAKTNWYTFNMRLFGKHIQDTSLVLKYGLMQTTNSLQLSNTSTAPALSKKSDSVTASGSTAGAELQVYLNRWLGLEGTIHQYRATSVAYGNHTLSGTYGECLGFIEIGVIRVQGGIFEERWNAKWPEQQTTTFEHGYVGGIKILL